MSESIEELKKQLADLTTRVKRLEKLINYQPRSRRVRRLTKDEGDLIRAIYYHKIMVDIDEFKKKLGISYGQINSAKSFLTGENKDRLTRTIPSKEETRRRLRELGLI